MLQRVSIKHREKNTNWNCTFQLIKDQTRNNFFQESTDAFLIKSMSEKKNNIKNSFQTLEKAVRNFFYKKYRVCL